MKLLLLTLFLLLFCCACNVINPDEREPAFVNIENFTIGSSSIEESSSEGISEMWVYANSDIQGVYNVPSRIPILKEGNTELTIFAGIKNNGIASTRIRYPFYAGFDTVISANALQSYDISPRFNYLSNANVDINRTFETQGNTFESGTNNQSEMQLIDDADVAIQGNKCIKVWIASGNTYMHLIDNINLVMQPGEVTFLEMNYSCNNTFALGVYSIQNSSSSKIPIIYITPTNTNEGAEPVWNKIYIDLGAIAGSSPNTDYYRIFMESVKQESETPTYFFDNIKILSF